MNLKLEITGLIFLWFLLTGLCLLWGQYESEFQERAAEAKAIDPKAIWHRWNGEAVGVPASVRKAQEG